jgi:hypothetical protein
VAAELVRAPGSVARRSWTGATLAGTILPIALVPFAAPAAGSSPTTGLTWALFVGSSVHVASTAWFYSVREVRAHMRTKPGRFFVAPLALAAGGAALLPFVDDRQLAWLLLAFFAWQFFHFQKQNLGITALAARAHRAPSLSRPERMALTATGVAGILGLLGRPSLLQVADAPVHAVIADAGLVLFAAAAAGGLALLARRGAGARPGAFTANYVIALVFFAPVWLFGSPYAAVAGLTIAHGLQYLLLVGMLAGRPPERRRARVSIVVLVDVAVLLGLALDAMSHLHGEPGLGRALFGVYLGLTAAHFVVDAGLWRLRDAFPRAFLTERLPFLLAPEPV